MASIGTVTVYPFSAGSDSRAVTIDSNANLVVIFIHIRNAASDVSGVTLNGVACTQLGVADPGGASSTLIYYMIGPPTGTPTLVVTESTSRSTVVAVRPIIGANTTTPFRDQGSGILYKSATGNPSNTLSLTATSATGDLVLDGFSEWDDTSVAVLTPDATQTSDYSTINASGSTRIRGAGTHKAGATTVTMSWTSTVSHAVSMMAVSIIPAAGGGGVAFPSTSVLDNFNRANGDAGADWVVPPISPHSTRPTISSNQLLNADAIPGNWVIAYWNHTFGPDQEIYLKAGGNFYYDLLLRYNFVTDSGYYAEWESDTLTMHIYVNTSGTSVELGQSSPGVALVSGDQLGFKVQGNNLSIYKNGTLLLAVQDAALTYNPATSYIGVGWGGTRTLDDFGGGAIAITYFTKTGGGKSTLHTGAFKTTGSPRWIDDFGGGGAGTFLMGGSHASIKTGATKRVTFKKVGGVISHDWFGYH